MHFLLPVAAFRARGLAVWKMLFLLEAVVAQVHSMVGLKMHSHLDLLAVMSQGVSRTPSLRDVVAAMPSLRELHAVWVQVAHRKFLLAVALVKWIPLQHLGARLFQRPLAIYQYVCMR